MTAVYLRARSLAPLVALLAPLAAIAPATGCGGGDDEGPRYRASIRRTSHGIPHIRADDLGSLGFGQGYAFAEDHGCVLADQIVKVRGERARWHGRGEGDANVTSDFAYRHLGLVASAEADFSTQPADVQEFMQGYVAGYNAFVASGETMPGGCDGEPWVGPISITDYYAYTLDLALLASGRQLVDYIGTAVAPGQGKQLPPVPLDRLASIKGSDIGSNGWGLGEDYTSGASGMLLANPHFPWEGELRLWESHLTIPGEYDVYGATLLGAPAVLIGFNEAVAWTHTVSAGQRFTFYKLSLDPESPTTYLYDGEPREMVPSDYTIQVKRNDGTLGEETRRLWRSHYGPILNIDPVGWTNAMVFSYRDANIGNRALISQFYAMNKARNLDEFKAAHENNLGIPWVNTMSTSAEGRAWYIDSTPTPNLSQESIDVWLDGIAGGDFFVQFFYESAGVPLLDGSTSRDEWVEEDGAREPGLVPWSELPQLERTDYIFNANDSHWLTNSNQLLEGYSPMHGFEGTPRTLRTRMNALLLDEREAGFAGEDGLYSIDEFREAVLSNRSMPGELLLDDLVARCEGAGAIDVGEGVLVDVGEACTALAAWDARFDLDSVGAVVFREWVGDFESSEQLDEGSMFAVGFDPADPVGTPNTLATTQTTGGEDRQLFALAKAVQRLNEAGVAIDAPLRDAQFTKKGDITIPIHGGTNADGVTNIVDYGVFKTTLDASMSRGDVVNGATGLTTEGYVINRGTSFIMSLAFTEDGPKAKAFLTYSQGSSKPGDPTFDDQTQLFSEKAWRDCLFTEEEIAADPELRSYDVSAPRPVADEPAAQD